MSTNIDRLLKKKSWTGEEVGKLLIANLIHDVECNKAGTKAEPLFTQEEFWEMEDSLTEQNQFYTYNTWKGIYSGIIESFNKANGMSQQFGHGYFRYINGLLENVAAELSEIDELKRPVIMTAEQYERYADNIRKKREDTEITALTLMIDIIKESLDNPKAFKGVSKAVDALKEMPVTNSRVLENYFVAAELGYYQLPDGTKDIDCTKEEYRAKEEKYFEEARGKIAELMDKEAIYSELPFDDFMDAVAEECKRLASMFFFRHEEAIMTAYNRMNNSSIKAPNGTEIIEILAFILENIESIEELKPYREELRTFLYADIDRLEFNKWHYLEGTPKTLMLYEIVTDAEVFEALYGKDETTLKEFAEDCPELYKELKAVIAKDFPKVTKYSSKQMAGKPLATRKELASLFVSYSLDAEITDDAVLTEYYLEKGMPLEEIEKCWLNGIAILKTDQEGKSDTLPKAVVPHGVLESAEDAERAEYPDRCKNVLLLPAIRCIYGYNELMRITGKVFGIDGIEAALIDTLYIESKIEELNETTAYFYYYVGGTPDERAEKRNAIREMYSYIDIEEMKPDKQAKEYVEAELSKAKASASTSKKRFDLFRFLPELSKGKEF